MANPEHLAILKQRVEDWNRWRVKKKDIVPDFADAKLHGANLQGLNLRNSNFLGADLSAINFQEADLSYAFLSRTDLHGANFRGASLTGANLYGANLHESNLQGANLREAILYGANLRETNFRKAYLGGADLGRARLQEANFHEAYLVKATLVGARLCGAIFSEADLGNTNLENAVCGVNVFADVDFSNTSGLETINHEGPSSVGIDTLYRSKGNIPEPFLRGCGVPDSMIEYAKSLTTNPIEYYSCFISYNSKDEEIAKRLYNDLQAEGVRCWFASHDMKIGDKIRSTIDDSIRIHDKLLLILSEHSVQSDWVEHEVEHALDLEKEREKGVLFPVRVDEAVMESKTGWAGNVRRQRHIGDFTRWKDHDAYSKAFERLLQDLKAG